MKYCKIDIFDINMVHQMQFDSPPKREQTIFKIVSNKIKMLFYFSLKPKDKPRKYDLLFYGVSYNNNKVLYPVVKNLSADNYFYLKDDKDYPMVQALYLSLPYIGSLISNYKKGTKEQRKLIKTNPLLYLLAYGKVKVAFKIINNYSPKLLVMANDHSPMNRSLLFAATKLGVKTMYLQHASVSTKFPTLKFDYTLLDGLESFEKYRCVSKPNSKVLLLGSPRFDSFYTQSIKNNNKNSVIGISINQFDDFEIIKELCLKIKGNTTFDVIVRPHPNMNNWYKDWFIENGIEYSNSSEISSNEYLGELFLQISNVCGIHLDAIILGVPTVQYQLSKKNIHDQYCYLEKGLIKKAYEFDHLIQYIKNPTQLIPLKEIVQYFVASSSTYREGQVGLFASNYICAILEKPEKETEIENKNKIKVYKF